MANDRWKNASITIRVPSPAALLKTNWSYWGIAFLLAPSLVWIYKDHSVWPWDQAWYGQVSADLWFWLGHSLRQWIATMADGLNMKPPGVSWLGQWFVPLGAVFGSIEAALLFSVLLTQFAMLFVLFRVGQGIFPGSRTIPAAGVLFAAASQLFTGLSHQMFVEPLQGLATVWAFYVAVKAPDWPKSTTVVHLGAALVLGLLAKATTPLYCLAPCLYSAYFLVRRPGAPDFRAEWKSRPSRILIVVFGCLAILCALWFFRHLGEVWRHVRDASSGDIALAYGSRDSLSHKLVLWWGLLVQSFLGPCLSWGCLAAILVAGVAYPSLRNRSSGTPRLSVRPVAVLSAIQTGLMLLVFSLNITVDSRYMYALLPCASILFMQICDFLPREALSALIALGAVQWALVNCLSLGIAFPLQDQSNWLHAIYSDRTQYDEISRAVRLTDSPGRYNIVAIEEPWLNANSASFFAAKQSLKTGARGYYTSIGYAQGDIGAAMRRIEDFQARRVITLDEPHQSSGPNYFNLVSSPVLERMRSDSRFTQFPFESRAGIVIFRFAPGDTASREEPDATGNPVQTPPADPRSVPEAVSRAKPRNRGKSSLGWVNGELPAQENGGRVFRVKGGALRSCLGWAFDDGDNSTPEEVWIELTHSGTGQRYYWEAARYSRPELADSFKLPSIRMAGIRCREPGIRLPPGTYRTRIYQAVGATVIVSDLSTYESSPVIAVE